MAYRDEREAREAFRRMDPKDKFRYILTYYRIYFLLAAAAAAVLISVVHHVRTKKDTVLYSAVINVALGSDMVRTLGEDFLAGQGMDPARKQVLLYQNLYLSEDLSVTDHEAVYASRMKLLAVISGKQLDFVLMNREAYDSLSQSGYLMDLRDLFSEHPELLEAVSPYLCENTVITEVRGTGSQPDDPYTVPAVEETAVNGLIFSGTPIGKSADFSDTVYLGIIANTPRTDICLSYIRYLFSAVPE